MALTRFQISCLSACLALPILLLMKVIGGIDSAIGTFATGVASLLVVFLIPKLYFREGPPKHDPFYNVWSIFLFASLVDMVIALENDGYIDKYLHFYLLRGEPYLKTAFGTMINYWDGTVHLALVLFILSRTAYNEDYRLACMYWCGSILNSVAVLVPGGAIGKFGPKWSILLNIPYIVIPLYILFSVLSSRSASKRNVLTSLELRAPQSPVDYTFILFFVASILVNGFRAAVALDCKADMTENYLKNFEPFIGDDTSFPKMQMLVYLFYFVPFYVYAVYRILYPANNGMLTDLAVFHAGAAAQAQFVYMTTAAHRRTSPDLRVPSDPTAQYCFWVINIALFLSKVNGTTENANDNESQCSNKPDKKRKRKRKRKHKNKKKCPWKIGDQCRAVFTEDNLKYDAEIVELDEETETCVIRYRGYGNEEEKNISELMRPTKTQKPRIKSDLESDSMDWSARQSPAPERSKRKPSHNSYPPFMQGMPFMPPFPGISMPQFPPFPQGSMGAPAMGVPFVPPPPPPLNDELMSSDNEALCSMLMSWYMSGYHTGLYQGMNQRKRQRYTSTEQDSVR